MLLSRKYLQFSLLNPDRLVQLKLIPAQMKSVEKKFVSAISGRLHNFRLAMLLRRFVQLNAMPFRGTSVRLGYSIVPE